MLQWPRCTLQEKTGMLSSRPSLLFCLATLLLTSNHSPAQRPVKHPDSAATTQPSPATAHYAFEVVSIRPSSPDAPLSFHRTPDGFQGTGMTLQLVLLLTHFPVQFWATIHIQNVPAWATQNRYDINAKVGPQELDAWTRQDPAEPAVMRSMLLSMLIDRCHLQFHTMPAEMPGFALAVTRHGASLQASTPDETPPPYSMKLTHGGFATGESLEDNTTTWHFHNASIASLANFVSSSAHTRILDQTGLTGRYDFALAMLPDRIPSNHGEIRDPANVWDLRALGLRTIPTKVPTVTLVIDHIDPPSENGGCDVCAHALHCLQ